MRGRGKERDDYLSGLWPASTERCGYWSMASLLTNSAPSPLLSRQYLRRLIHSLSSTNLIAAVCANQDLPVSD